MNIADSGLLRIAASLALTALLVGCGPGDEQAYPAGVRDEVYIQVMTELLLLDSRPPDGETPEEREAKADSVRGEILASHGVTAQEMLDFARVVGGEAARMEGLWHRITQKYDSLRIAELRRETEANSEAEGKLGEDARAGPAGSTAPGAGEVNRKPNAADSRDSTGAPTRTLRSRSTAIQRPAKTLPSARDTTVPPRG